MQGDKVSGTYNIFIHKHNVSQVPYPRVYLCDFPSMRPEAHSSEMPP